MRNNNDNHDMTDRLIPLSSLKDYKVASDSTDVLGWRVAGADGDNFGVVKDLVVDPQTLKVRYLYVVADRKFFDTSNDPYLLIPIGAAALDKKGKKVFVSYVDSNSVSRYPVYGGGPITEDYEYAVRDMFQQSQNKAMTNTQDYRNEFEESVTQQQSSNRHISDDFYNHDNYNENRFFSSNWQEERTDVVDDSRHVDTDPHVHTDTNVYAEGEKSKTVEDSIATIERLEQLRKRGSITDEEYTVLKKRALNL